MNQMVICDIETQDFPVQTGIFEVACLAIENGKIIDRLYLGKKIPGYKGSTQYGKGFYNIANDQESIDQFQTFMKKYPYPIVAHNCPFEKKFLTYYQWIDESQKLYCSMRAIRYEKLPLKSFGMDSLSEYFKVTIHEQHTAMGDVLALYEIIMKAQPKLWLQIGEKKR
ncbi:MAG: 3'-5' exonuclease [Clostridia bacterium]|nr:3'-5' exonuclease [Clostridia bacterium]